MRGACIATFCCLSAFGAAAQHTAPAAPKLLLLPSIAHGVDPVVARFVDRGLRRSSEQSGYALTADTTPAAPTAVPAGTTVGPSMVELWQRVHVSGADYAVLALVSAREGRYALELRVACRDGSGPFYAHGEASNVELEQAAGKLLESVLPARGEATRDPVQGPVPIQGPVPTPVPVPVPVPAPAPIPVPVPTPAPVPVPNPPSKTNPYRNAIPNPNPYHQRTQLRAAHRTQPHNPYGQRDANPYRDLRAAPGVGAKRVRLVAHDEVVLGTDRDGFVGALLGVRADYQMGPALYLGVYGGYANLPGRVTRAHSLLTYAQLEHRIQVGERIGVPSRFALGYLAHNGAVLRLSSGVAVKLTDSLELVFDVLSPMFWVTPDTTLFSLNLGLELGTRF